MRTIFVFIVFFISSISFAQKPAVINLKDSCIISGGIIKISDFKKLCKICPPNVQRVLSFNISYPLNPPIYGELPCKGYRYKASVILPSAQVGKVIVIDNIKAISMDGKPVDVPSITLGFSK